MSESERLFIPVVCGSIRPNRRSLRPTQLIVDRVAEAGHETHLVDLRELDLPLYDEEVETEAHSGVAVLRQIMARSDASIWQSLRPERHRWTPISRF